MISIIVAIAQNGVIGQGKDLPWNYPEDLRYFKQITSNHTVVMGRTTFESIVSRLHQPLPNRNNIVVTNNRNWHYPKVQVVNRFLDYLQEDHDEEVFVIGGKQIYETALNYAHRLYITHIFKNHSGDVFFPRIDFSLFQLISETPSEGLSFCIYERIKK
jgi:dihydrofolate reductase